jgi:hypothetical protein
MKRWMLAGSLICSLNFLGTTVATAADGMFWVVGNHATNGCDIVTKNPVIDGDIWFGDGPYKSKDDAKLARSTINACPKTEDKDDKSDPAGK